MGSGLVISVDGMGGDHAPDAVLDGIEVAARKNPGARFLVHGPAGRMAPMLEARPAAKAASEVRNAETFVSMEVKPSQALRQGKGTSMWNALVSVEEGDAQACVSAGNTGALMAMSKLILRPIANVQRPAIAALWPTIRSECIVLDVGANIGADATQLCDFALMGAAMARALFQIERPSVGLLNVGTEEVKGADEVKEAHAWLRAMAPETLPFEYRGFMEGNEIGQGRVDVVVVEGFAGNIALKTAEGTARQIGQYIRDALTRSTMSKLGALLARGGLQVLKHKMDPRRVNGGTFLGLNGIAIKSHGGTDALGFASAVDLGYDMAERDLVARLKSDVETFHGALASRAAG